MEGSTDGVGKIGWAVAHMRNGFRVRRTGWSGDKLWLAYVPAGAIQIPQKIGDGFRTAETLVMKNSADELVPWACSLTDLLAKDWMVLDAPQPGVTHYDDKVVAAPV